MKVGKQEEKCLLSSGHFRALIVGVLLPSLSWWNGPLRANPEGGSVVHGDIQIGAGTGGILDIRQSSNTAIINWERFSIDAGELTRFQQPGTGASVLNRVSGGNPTEIFGALQANGNVFVINPSGILVGAGGAIDVHGLVLSTLDVSNGEFLAGGDMVFEGVGEGVTNMGRISAVGGDVFLIGRTVTNAGAISASGGTVGLAAGEEVLLAADTGPGGERLFVRTKGSGVSGTGVLNDGTIEGAAVELKAHGNMYALAINNKGTIRATGAIRSGGRVHLKGIGGTVANSGTIRAFMPSTGEAAQILIEAAYARVDGVLHTDASLVGGTVKVRADVAAEIGATISAGNGSGVGGSVDIEAPEITLKADSLVDVSGSSGGGSVRIGGAFQGGDPNFQHATTVAMQDGATILADAEESGGGGTVVLWSDQKTEFQGEIFSRGTGSAKGGLVEVSSRGGLLVDGMVSTLAENGQHGTLLLDPKNLTISSSGSSASNINNGTLQNLVVNNHVVVSTFDPGTTEAGTISVLSPVVYTSGNSLTLLAEGDIYIGDDVINRGTGNVNLVAGWDPAVLSLTALLGVSPSSPGTTFGNVDMNGVVFSTAGACGAGQGSVYVGSLGAPNVAADRAVVVASRDGQTNVAGYNVLVWGSAFTGGINQGAQRYSQIGYNRRDAGTEVASSVTGDIRVKALNDIEVVANKYEKGIVGSSGWNSLTDNTGNASFAQIGHGGERDSVEDMQLSGTILVEAGGNLSLLGGLAYNNHASIGHGGYDNLDIDGTNLATLGGAITVTAGGDVNLIAGIGFHAHTQIGHGGGNHRLVDFTESNILVTAGGDVKVLGGAGTPVTSSSHDAQSQIGHGGKGADFMVGGVVALAGSGKGYKGEITVNAGGSVRVEAGKYDAANIAVIGNGGIDTDGDHSGIVRVTAGGGIDVIGGTDSTTLFAQIGHIAYNASNNLSGDVTVQSGDGGIRLQGGNSTANYATIGNGGYQILDGSVISGGTYVISRGTDALDGITLQSGNGSYSSAHIGHLAHRTGDTMSMTLSGLVDVEIAGGGLLMKAADLGNYSHVMLGHGGRNISGSKTGTIDVRVASGNISMQAGGSAYNHAQIGHGGLGIGITGVSSDAITIETKNGNIEILAGRNSYSYAQVGHGGMRLTTASETGHVGVTTVKASGDISVGGSDGYFAYAQIGHGGGSGIANNVMHLGGAINVEAGNTVTAAGGKGSYSYGKIGHGGVSPVSTMLSSIAASPISVKAITGDVLLLSGTASYTGAKIGHGDTNLKLSSFGESSVEVVAGRHIRLVSPQFDSFSGIAYSGTQIGHGGWGAIVGDVPSAFGYTGNVAVTAGGKLDVLAGKNSGSYNWSLLGHTSYYNSSGKHSGNITVTTGTVAGLDAYGVTVHGGSEDFKPVSETNLASGYYYSFASIGHRSHSNGPATYSTGLSGDILVDVIRGGVTVLGGDGVDGSTSASTPPEMRLNGAQIGHGGYSSGHLTYGMDGSVRIHAEGDIILRSGTSRQGPVLIGHGGYASFGPMGLPDDVIEVISKSGSLELDSSLAISNERGGVMIGSGSLVSTSGTRQGDILVDVAGEISFVGDRSTIGHRTNTTGGISDADVTIRSRSFDRVTGDSGSGLFAVDTSLGSMLVANMAGGHLSLVGMGSAGIEMDSRMVWDTAFDVNLLSYSNIFVVDDLINRGSGDINIFAGWNPAIAPLFSGATSPFRGNWIRDVNADTDLFGVTSSYGKDGGSIWVGAKADFSAADRSVVVGSRLGQTNVAGYDVRVWGAAFTGGIEIGHQRYSQIGYTRVDGGSAVTDPVTGRIRVGAVQDVEVAANHYEVGVIGYGGWGTGTNNSGNASYAQIGHGGERTSVRDQTLNGEIIVEAGGDVDLKGGITFNNHATIGHGAYDNPDDDDDNNLAVLGGKITVAAGGDVNLTAGLGYYAQAQIGHGGASHYLADFIKSDISVTAGGDVSLLGGGGSVATAANQSSAQIGHGGYNGDFIENSDPGVPNSVIPVSAGSGRGYKGNILVNAGGSVKVTAGMLDSNNFAAIGNGGILADGDHSGEITVNAGKAIELKGGSGATGLFAQIGHIVYESSNAISGSVRVQSGDGGILLEGGSSTANYATIGSGGYEIKDGSSIGGGTFVTSLGTDPSDGIVMRAGSGNYSSAQIGHLAERTVGGFVHPDVGLSGEVRVSVAGGGLAMDASVLGYFTHVQIGHGGRDITGTKSGEITVTVTSGDIVMTSGGENPSGRYSHAQIGHGGYGNGVTGNIDGSITLEALAGKIAIIADESYGNYSQVGHGGFGAGSGISGNFTGSIRVLAENDIALSAGDAGYTFARIGHGGRDTDGNHGLAGESIQVISRSGNLELAAGSGADSLAQIGHGDNNDSSGTRNGDILVDVAGEISLASSANAAWIGHRTTTGSSALGNADVTVRAQGLDTIAGDSGNELFSIDGTTGGMFGANLSGGHVSLIATGSSGLEVTSAIIGNSSSDLNLLAHSNLYLAEDVLNQGAGDVNVVAGWNPALAPLTSLALAAPYREYFVRDVNMDTDLFSIPGAFGASSGSVYVGLKKDQSAADLGVVVGSRVGQTNVAGHDVSVVGGALTGTGKYSQIGFSRLDGGVSVASPVTGRIRVLAKNNVLLQASQNTPAGIGSDSFARIGHGGGQLSGAYSGEINVVAKEGDVLLSAGDATGGFTTIGHGGYSGAGDLFGKIAVQSELGTLSLLGGDGSGAVSQIGHGGSNWYGVKTGEIVINAAGLVDLQGGNGIGSVARIGHGGIGSVGNTTGNLTLETLAGLSLTGGSGAGSGAQIGHGGRQGSGILTGSMQLTTGRDVQIQGGAGMLANAQIGHGGYGFSGSVVNQNLELGSGGKVLVNGGTGIGASAQIGHGGSSAPGVELSGDIDVSAPGNLEMNGGLGSGAYAQIGNGGISSSARKGGKIVVTSGADILMEALNGANFSYSKIGHGDDLPASASSFPSGDERSGDIQVGAASNITLRDSMIGHVNSSSAAVLSGGVTKIAASMAAPTDPLGGILTADAASEFVGADELRFYLPRRASNQIATGALLNEVSFPGARIDPSDTQRYDEFVVHITGDVDSSPNQHANSFTSGAAPTTNPAGYGFYYDTISLIAGSGDLPLEVPGGGTGGGPGSGNGSSSGTGSGQVTPPTVSRPIDYSFFVPDDKTKNDWLKKRGKKFSGFGDYEILYEGFDQYGITGESLFRVDRDSLVE